MNTVLGKPRGYLLNKNLYKVIAVLWTEKILLLSND